MVQILLRFFAFSILLQLHEYSKTNTINKIILYEENSLSIKYLKKTSNGSNIGKTYDHVEGERQMQAPTSMPSSDVKVMSVRFSVQLGNNDDLIIESESGLKGADDKLQEALLQTTTQFLCEDTTFFIASKIHQSRDICESFKRANEDDDQQNSNGERRYVRNMQQVLSRTKLLVDPTNAISAIPVTSISDPEIQWLQVSVEYSVLETSDQVLLLSDQSVGRLSPIQIIERTTELVTGQRVNEGSFGKKLSQADDRVWRVSILGQEESQFTMEDDYYYDDDFIYTVKPLHSLRIAGIALFGVFSCITIVLFGAGRARNREAIWEQKRMLEGSGGLATDQGVDAMLQVGRLNASTTDPNAFYPDGRPRAEMS